jgi:hypothetical protein
MRRAASNDGTQGDARKGGFNFTQTVASSKNRVLEVLLHPTTK